MRKNIVIVTGGPGFGKTSIARELSARGFPVGNEAAREIIAKELSEGSDVLPWKNIKAFQLAVLEQRVAFWQSVIPGQWAFADRGLPDQLAFANFRGFKASPFLISQVEKFHYYSEVFVCPPWFEIYRKDEIRRESFDEACRLHDEICNVYNGLGYQLVILPRLPAKERVEIILAHLQIDLK